MMLDIPEAAEFITLEFALPGGGTHRQRVTVSPWREYRLCDVITSAVRACKRRRRVLANLLRVTWRDMVLYEAAGRLPRGFAR